MKDDQDECVACVVMASTDPMLVDRDMCWVTGFAMGHVASSIGAWGEMAHGLCARHQTMLSATQSASLRAARDLDATHANLDGEKPS